MPLYLPVVALFVWLVSIPLAVELSRAAFSDLPDWELIGLANLIYCAGGIVLASWITIVVRRYFVRQLRGFGLSFRTAGRDFGGACVNLTCIWPLVLAAIVVSTRIGRMIYGPDFELQPHEQLELISAYPQWPLRALIVVAAVVVAPVAEEMLFRGLFQTSLRSFLSDLGYRQSAWLSIAGGSVLFAMAHAQPGHWPALFVLSLGMGYSYEKSNSLLRSIFIHALFNGITILAVLAE